MGATSHQRLHAVHVNKSLLVFKDFGYQHTTTMKAMTKHIDVALNI